MLSNEKQATANGQPEMNGNEYSVNGTGENRLCKSESHRTYDSFLKICVTIQSLPPQVFKSL